MQLSRFAPASPRAPVANPAPYPARPLTPTPPAGYETTANTLAYAVWAISAHPRVQARVLAEVDAFGRGRPVGYEHLQAAGGPFPYLHAVLKETTRM